MELKNRQEVNIFKRSTSFLSYLAGDGEEIEKTQADLNELTAIFNQNFHHIHQDEELLRLKLNQLITNENKLSQQETVLHNKIQILEIDTYKQTRKLEFEQRRNQQLGSLTNMIQNCQHPAQTLVQSSKQKLELDTKFTKVSLIPSLLTQTLNTGETLNSSSKQKLEFS